ncbi:DUF2586 domain-containing protein [Aquimarina sp. AD10]|uniref:DUF2586 family protein n=1 Tax=Aquimarina sp. AD10 TaxID=1714849 RepID=UPI000E4B31A2|nr:DUF2586 family protein [Aquimarina sp. AD10]AXT59710.1 DUF2586 domain-containing protein [Aquimarina sp. AD10]RKM97586.1 DUF2586 domain-containing protein [Aquimarina sp. AD10]
MGNLLNDVVINKLSGGLGRRTPDRDMVSGLLFDLSPSGTKKSENPNIEVGRLYRFASLEDAEGSGFVSSIDKNGCSVYYQIAQFFRINPSGDLLVMGVDNSVAIGDNTEDTYQNLVAQTDNLLTKANGEIRQLAVSFGKLTTTFAETTGAVGVAATITRKAFETDYRPLEILLEGKGFGELIVDGGPGVATAENLRGLNAPNVSVTIAIDPEKANETGGNFKNTAAVGVLLGAVSRAKVSENIAWIEKFNLTGEGFRSVGYVGGLDLPTEGDQGTLNNLGYIFSRKHIGIPGVYFNDSHTCTLETDDFAFIEANRTINKAARISRTALLPKLNSPVLVDPETGKLPPSVVKGYETLCRSALERMISNEEASDIDVFVDPNQDILANSQLNIKIAIVPLGTARKIVVDLGFKNPFQINAAAAS